MKSFNEFIFESIDDDTIHFHVKHHGTDKKKMTTFTEKMHKGTYSRGSEPMTYHYSHDSGNMNMKHPDLYAPREIMARSLSGQKAGADPAIPNDHKAALKIATSHLIKYRGDNKTYLQRTIDNKEREIDHVKAYNANQKC